MKNISLLLDRLLVIAVVVLITAIPLYPKFPAFRVAESHVYIRVDDFLVAATLPLTFLAFWRRRKEVFSCSVSRFIILYWGAGLISLFSAIFINHLALPHLAVLHYLRRIEYMGLFFLGFLAIRSKRELKDLFFFLFLALVLIFFYGLGQKFFGFPVISTMDKEFAKGRLIRLDVWTRVSATFAGHYDLAAYLSLLFPLILTAAFSVKNKKNVLPISFVYLSSYYLLILTASRVSFFSYLLSVSFFLLLLKKRVLWVVIVALSLLGALFSQDINQRFAATIKVGFPKLTKQLASIFPAGKTSSLHSNELEGEPLPTVTPTPTVAPIYTAGQKHLPTPTPLIKVTPKEATAPSLSRQEAVEIGVERSGNIRFQVEWPRAIKHFLINPPLGTGYSSLTLATDNDFLRALGETGLLGFLSFFSIPMSAFLLFYRIFRKGKKVVFEKQLAVAGMALILAMLLNALFIDVFEASKVAYTFWLLLGSLVGFFFSSVKILKRR